MEKTSLIHPGLMNFWVYFFNVKGSHYQGLTNILGKYGERPLTFFTLVPEEADVIRGYLLVEGISAEVILVDSPYEVPPGDYPGYRIFTFDRKVLFRESIDSFLPNISL